MQAFPLDRAPDAVKDKTRAFPAHEQRRAADATHKAARALKGLVRGRRAPLQVDHVALPDGGIKVQV